MNIGLIKVYVGTMKISLWIEQSRVLADSCDLIGLTKKYDKTTLWLWDDEPMFQYVF